MPLGVDFGELVERERKKGGVFRIREEVVWKRVLWWPYLDCVLNMEPYHPDKKIAFVLAVDWTGLENAEGLSHYDDVVRKISLVGAFLALSPPEEELKHVPGLPETDLAVPQNVSLWTENNPVSLCSTALRDCRDVLIGIRHGARIFGGQESQPKTRFFQAIHQAKPVVEGLMLPEGYEAGEQAPEERKIAGITTESLTTHGSLRDKGFWMIQSQRPFWVPNLVVHYASVNCDPPYGRVIVYDRDGKKLLEKLSVGKLIPWVSELEEHQALEGTVTYLVREFGRLDKERTSTKDKGEEGAAATKALAILDQLDRLLPTYKDLDRKLRFDFFCSAAMLCDSVGEFSRGIGYAKAALGLAPNDGRSHLCYALNAVHFAETRDDAVQSCLKAVQLPYIVEDMKMVSDSLQLLKLCLGQEEAANSLAKLAEGARSLYPSVAEKLFGNSQAVALSAGQRPKTDSPQ